MNDIEKLRICQLKIVEEIKRICDKYRIEYFLDSGSLLGAIRHDGFIPWDDDIDIGMKKEEYVKFLRVAQKELKNDFYLDNYQTNKNNPYVFTKLRLKGTVFLEEIGNIHLNHNEIFVDIFPYYYVSANPIVRKVDGIKMAFLAQAVMSKYGYKNWKGQGIKKRIKFIPSDIVGKIVPIEFLRDGIDKLFNKHNKTGLVGIQAGSCYGFWYFPEQVIEKLEDHVFENHTFRIPQKYDYYLTKVYGEDYMEIPPFEKRKNHQIIKLDFGDINF